jgi:hypothetical protein
MKKISLIIICLLTLNIVSIAQQADKTLDFLQTKDGRKYYGKIKEINPKEGVTFQTYGEGDEFKLKHEEIEIIKLASQQEKKSEDKKESRFWNSFSVVSTQSLLEKSTETKYIFNDTNNVGLSTLGVQYSVNWFSRNNKRLLSIYTGFQNGRNINNIPFGLEMRFIRNINEKHRLNIGVGANFDFLKQKFAGFTDPYNGNEIPASKTPREITSTSTNLGMGYLYDFSSKFKFFINLDYKWSKNDIYFYQPITDIVGYTTTNGYTYSTSYRQRSAPFRYGNVQVKIGILFK